MSTPGESGASAGNGWLVLDDYHFIVGSAAAERLVEAVADATQMRMLIASRRRPRWASARRAMYGEVEEATQADLAFTAREAAKLLPHVPSANLSEWVARTKGWPALLKLASVSGNRELPDLELPPELHDYFAEELFQAASSQAQSALVRLVALPALRPRLLRLALGADYISVCKEAVALGFLTESADGTF
jgi:ATP/maltotriose-dependent transcriptional regulator MalT